MSNLAKLLFVIGVCAATIGAAGFHDPARTEREGAVAGSTEGPAWPLFAGGMIAIGAGSVVNRAGKKGSGSTAAEHHANTLGAASEILSRIRDEVVSLDDAKHALAAEEICTRIDALLKGHYFDLVDLREDLVNLVGFGRFVSVWDGVATAERQLARVWSIATDGYLAEALEDLPTARANLDLAVAAMRALQSKE